MTTINLLTTTTVQAGDSIPVYSTNNSDARRFTVSALSDFIISEIPQSSYITQYASPSATGYTIQVVNPGKNTFLLITALANYADGTIVLADTSQLVDGQEVLVTSTKSVTTLTVTGGPVSPVTVNGAPTTLAVNGFFRLRYDAINSSWYRIG